MPEQTVETVTISEKEYNQLKEAKNLLWTVLDDYQTWGEVLQDTTIGEIEEFFRER